jgi:hypothetical protein
MTSTPGNSGSTDFEGTAVAAPAAEQPAADTPSGDSGPASVGAAHPAGTMPGEDVDFRDPFEHDEDGGEG